MPPLSVLTAIEGINIIDLIPPGVFVGRQTGMVALVGEWPKGPMNTPTVVEGDQTITDVFGGFSLSVTDPLSFSTNPFSNGNASVWLNSKKYSSLVLCRADLSLALGVKIQLTSSPSTAATGSIQIPAAGGGAGGVADGQTFTLYDGINNPPTTFQFVDGGVDGAVLGNGNITIGFTALSTQANVATSVQSVVNGIVGTLLIPAGAPAAGLVGFTNDNPGIQGNQLITTSTPGAAITYTVDGMSGGEGLYTLPADLVIPAGTRVHNSAALTQEFALAQDVVFEAGTILDTAAFTAYDIDTPKYSTRTVSAIPVYSTQGVSEGGAALVDTANSTDLFRAGIGTGTQYPTIVVTASTALLDGAAANTGPITVLSSAVIDSRYADAIDSLLPGEIATDNIELVCSARQSNAIRTKLQTHVRDASSVGGGRVALNRPPAGTSILSATSNVAPGVGANRADNVIYCYPHFVQNISDLSLLDPNAVISAPDILLGADAAMATILSNIPPEENPGEATDLLSFILRLEPNLTGAGRPTKFTEPNYETFKASGIAALHRDSRAGIWDFQSGVTSVNPSLQPTQAPIKRRRFAYFVQDSMAAISLSFNKKPGTTERKDSLLGELFDFLDELKSETNPTFQRIENFSIDSKSGNTSNLSGLGVHVIKIKVRMLASLDYITLVTTVGETVTVTAEG